MDDESKKSKVKFLRITEDDMDRSSSITGVLDLFLEKEKKKNRFLAARALRGDRKKSRRQGAFSDLFEPSLSSWIIYPAVHIFLLYLYLVDSMDSCRERIPRKKSSASSWRQQQFVHRRDAFPARQWNSIWFSVIFSFRFKDYSIWALSDPLLPPKKHSIAI